MYLHTRHPGGKKIYAFYDIYQWPQDMNLTSHALLTVLTDFTEEFPEILYLQLELPYSGLFSRGKNFTNFVMNLICENFPCEIAEVSVAVLVTAMHS